MLKPIKTIKLKTVGLGMDFARRITQRAAVFANYELSESELVFALGTAREQSDLMSVLELLDELLDMVRHGFDRRANFLSVRLINNIGIILSRGGFSREYNKTLEIYNKITAVMNGNSENFDYSECRNEIQNTLSSLRSRSEFRSSTVREKPVKTVSERGKTTVLNTLNSGLIAIMSRNPELYKMISSDKAYTELTLKNIGELRRRTALDNKVRRFFDSLTNDQIVFLEKYISERNLFSELSEFKEKAAENSENSEQKTELRYLLENSSRETVLEFFETLKKDLEKHKLLIEDQASENSSSRVIERNSEQDFEHFFGSEEKMREFFVGAQSVEIKRLIKELNNSERFQKQALTLEEALEIYEKNSEKIRSSEEKLTEIFRESEAVLENKLRENNFSLEHFFASLEGSHELKKLFSEYVWENYRSEETLKKFAECSEKISGVSKTSAGSEKTENPENPETAKLNFAEFLISSKELENKFSESVKNSFTKASSEVTAAFAEYLVNTVREGSFNYFNKRVISLAEKAESVLYYDGSKPEKKSAELFSLIESSWDTRDTGDPDTAAQLSELYSGFTQSGKYYDGIMKLYLSIPKNNFTAFSEFFKAAAQNDRKFIEISENFSEFISENITKNTEKNSGSPESISSPSNGASGYTFYDALTEFSEMPEFSGIPGISDDPLTLLLPLAGNNEVSVSPENPGKELPGEAVGNTAIAGEITGQISSELTEFSRYLSEILRAENSSNERETITEKIGNFENIRGFSERLETVLRTGKSDLGERYSAAENLTGLIYREWSENSETLSRLFREFEQSETAKSSREPEIKTAEKTVIKSGFTERIEKYFRQIESENNKILLAQNPENSAKTQSIFAQNMTVLEKMLPSILSISDSREPLIFNIAKAENGSFSGKNIVINKRLYSAVKALSGSEFSSEPGEKYIENYIENIGGISQLINLNYSPKNDPVFSLESENPALFNRAVTNQTYLRNSSFLEKIRSKSAVYSERISEKIAEESRRSEYNTAVELFYTDEYFEYSRNNGSGNQINYALPSAAPSSSENVTERLGNIHEKLENINTEITSIKQREEELSREFVTKSEQKVFERELKSSIERDIYLAGKRHGIY